MTVVTNTMWLVATAIAVTRARQGKLEEHKRWMVRSYFLLTTPITQRIVDYVLALSIFVPRAMWAIGSALLAWIMGAGEGLFGFEVITFFIVLHD